MKIGIFDPYLDTLGGGEKYMLTAASCLSKNNEVFVFWDKFNILEEAQNRFDLDLSNVKITPNIFSYETKTFQRIIKSRKFDLIIYLSDGSIPLLLTSLIIHFQFPVEWVDVNSFVDRMKILRVKKIICNSYFTKKYIDRKFNVTSTVLYPPVDKGSQSKEKENIILTVGRFGRLPEGSNFKKQDVMIKVFKKMVDNGLKNWEFFVVVSFKDEDQKGVESLEKLAQNYPIMIYKNLSFDEIRKLYRKAKIYWHAAGYGENLVSHPEKAEHFGISTVEAMSYGSVPAVFKAGGQTEIVESNRSGFLWKSLDEFAQKTQELIKNDNLWNAMSKEAVKRSHNFSGNRFCEELKEIVYS